MTLPLIRASTAADLPALVELHNAASPDQPTTLAVQTFKEQSRRPELPFGRLVAERSGQVCGVTTFSRNGWTAEPDKLGVSVTVHPEHQGQGVGRALYDALLAEMRPHRPIALSGTVREDNAVALHFAASRRFTEVARDQEVELLLSQLEPSMRQWALDGAAAAGYTLLTFGEYGRQVGTDAAWQRLHALDGDAGRDVPLPPGDTLETPTLERYRQTYDGHPNFDPELWFVAEKNGELVAVSQLWGSPLPDLLNTGFTGVARAHRGHRLAWALKYRALDEAVRRGKVRVRTANDALNLPMRRINAGLGFLPIPAYLTLSLTLTGWA